MEPRLMGFEGLTYCGAVYNDRHTKTPYVKIQIAGISFTLTGHVAHAPQTDIKSITGTVIQ
jgi:hypothetical protein